MEYTGLQQYTGRAKGVTPSGGSNAERSEAAEAAEAAERSSANSPPLPAREGAPLEAPPEAPQKTHFRLFSHGNRGAKLYLYWPGVVAVIYTEKIQEKVKKNRCHVWR